MKQRGVYITPEHIDWAAYETVTVARSRWLAICADTNLAVSIAAWYFWYASVPATWMFGSAALTPLPNAVADCWARMLALRVSASEVGAVAPARRELGS